MKTVRQVLVLNSFDERNPLAEVLMKSDLWAKLAQDTFDKGNCQMKYKLLHNIFQCSWEPTDCKFSHP
ncbi:MAG: hypothetical protein HYS98_08370 [Deltaproteobacteria bacterium]|nr:hypothetical protein [Deltaproteobacteria bacterium]